jgi:hypothetical protein
MTSLSDPVDIADITHVLNDEPVETPVSRPRGDKISEGELEQRIRLVVKWISRGMPYSDVVANCDGYFGVCQRTAERYAAEANRRIREANAKDRDLEIAKAKARYETLLSLSVEDRQFAAAINANNALVKLLGLAEPDKVEHGASDTLTQLVAQIRGGDPKEPV